VLGVDLQGHQDVLGRWLGDGADVANIWFSVITDPQGCGVEDIFIACIEGLTGFKDAVDTVFPATEIQLCIIHQIRHSLQYAGGRQMNAWLCKQVGVQGRAVAVELETKFLECVFAPL